MNTFPAAKYLLLPEARSAPVTSATSVRRYRLARVRHSGVSELRAPNVSRPRAH